MYKEILLTAVSIICLSNIEAMDQEKKAPIHFSVKPLELQFRSGLEQQTQQSIQFIINNMKKGNSNVILKSFPDAFSSMQGKEIFWYGIAEMDIFLSLLQDIKLLYTKDKTQTSLTEQSVILYRCWAFFFHTISSVQMAEGLFLTHKNYLCDFLKKLSPSDSSTWVEIKESLFSYEKYSNEQNEESCEIKAFLDLKERFNISTRHLNLFHSYFFSPESSTDGVRGFLDKMMFCQPNETIFNEIFYCISAGLIYYQKTVKEWRNQDDMIVQKILQKFKNVEVLEKKLLSSQKDREDLSVLNMKMLEKTNNMSSEFDKKEKKYKKIIEELNKKDEKIYEVKTTKKKPTPQNNSQQIEKLKKKNSTQKNEMNSLIESKKQLQMDNSKITEELKTMKKNHEEKIEEQKKYYEELLKKEQENKLSQKSTLQKNQGEEKIKNMKIFVANMQKQNENLKENISKKNQQISDLENDTHTQKEQISELKKSNEIIKEKYDILNEKKQSFSRNKISNISRHNEKKQRLFEESYELMLRQIQDEFRRRQELENQNRDLADTLQVNKQDFFQACHIIQELDKDGKYPQWYLLDQRIEEFDEQQEKN